MQRTLAAALLAATVGLGAASVVGPAHASETGTTTPSAGAPTTKPGRAAEVLKRLDAMAGRLQKVANAAKRQALAAKVAAARSAASTGNLPSDGSLQALEGEIKAAAEDGSVSVPPPPNGSVPPGSGGPSVPSVPPGSGGPSVPPPPGPSVRPVPPPSGGPTSAPAGEAKGRALAALQGAARRVAGSSLPDAQKSALLARIAELRGRIETGKDPGEPSVGVVLKAVAEAFEPGKGGEDKPAAPKPVDPAVALATAKAKVSASSLDAAAKTALLAKIDALMAAIAGGQKPAEGAVRSVLDEVHRALGLKADDGAKRSDELRRRLEESRAKVAGAPIDDAVKTPLLDRIDAALGALAAGTRPSEAELEALGKAIAAALEQARATKPERPDAAARAAEVLKAQIEKIAASDLPADVKAQINAALQAALDKVASGADPKSVLDGGKDPVRTALEQQRASKVAELKAKLATAADKMDAAIDALAAKGADPAKVDAAKALIADARSALALAEDHEDLRAVWAILRDARLALTGGTPGS